MRRHLRLVPACCALGLACTAAPAVDTDAERSALRQADSSYSRAATSKDRATFVGLYAPDAVMYPPEAPVVTGIEAIGTFVDGFLKDTLFAAEFRPLAVDVSADGTMGYTLNAAQLSFTGPDGKLATEHIRDLHVWRKQADGSWKLLIDLWNVEPPATPAAKN